MATVREITITTDIKDDGAVTGHTITANVDVGGEQRSFEFSAADPVVKSVVDQLVNCVLKEALQESRTEMQGVVDAQKAFER
ncbi:MAG TPA: hypothetical protein VNL71_13195 [Chloroflexota bacterium]|nr:hypothetical protein [Chloroflexota bacterium]